MKRLLVLPLLIATACASHMTSDIQPGDAEPAVRRMEREFTEAANAGEVNGMMTIYANDAVLMPPNAPEVHGAAAIREYWSGLIALKPKVMLTPVTIMESCDMATELGTYELTLGAHVDKGKYVVTWRRANGEWRAVADIFNSSLPSQM